MHDKFFSSSFLFTLDLVCLILPTLRTPAWGLWYSLYQLPITQIYNTTTHSLHSQIARDFYMPFYPMAWTLQFFIIPQHQPLLSSFTMIWTNTLLSHWHNGVLLTTSLVAWELKTRKKHIEKNMLLFFFTLLLILTSYRPFHKPSNSSLHHPLFGVAPILHNSQTNNITNPCIPCSRNKMTIRCKCAKIDGYWQ